MPKNAPIKRAPFTVSISIALRDRLRTLSKSLGVKTSSLIDEAVMGLLTKYAERVVCLVEAEKTAIICAGMMPEFIWLATGGKSGFNDRVEVLDGRKVIAFPDVDAYDQWCEKAAERPYLDITVSDYLQQNATEEELNSGADIADLLIRWQQENDLPPVSSVSPVSDSIQPIQPIHENPVIAEIRKYISPEYLSEVAALIEELDLELVSVTHIPNEQ